MSTKGNRKVKAQTVLEAIPDSAGIISTIAARMRVDWHTAKKAIEENEEAKLAYEAEVEKRLDHAESVILINIRKSIKQQEKGYFADSSDAKWYLSKMGKKRGYTDLDITSGGKPIGWKDFINGGDSDTEPDSK